MATHPIRFGIQTGQQNVAWPAMLDLWQKADAWGYDSLWNFDHFFPIFTDPSGPCFEGWTTLTALGQATKRARIGHLVNGNTYRNPCVLAKMATTLDHISGGRLNLGIGAGWFEEEHRALGIDFKSVRGRLEALDEACRILLGMFSGERFSLQGKHYTVNEALGQPTPVQKPHPPLMIGGTGEKHLLRIVAKYADMWNASAGAERIGQLVDVIRRHGDAVGRDTEQIEKTVMLPLCYKAQPERERFLCQLVAGMRQCSPEEARGQIMIGDEAECLATIERFGRAGATHFIFMMFPPYFVDEVQAFAEEVIPAVRGS